MNITILPEFETLSQNKGTELHVLIQLRAPAETAGKQRNPISLSLVIDRSGSMDGEKIQLTREAACYIINWLTRRDFASVVTYDSKVELLVPFQPLTQKPLIMEAIEKIKTDGCTNLSGGWLRGLSSLEDNFQPGNIHRLILLTDGQANEGITEDEKLSEMANFYRQKGITTTTLGFGEGFNEKLLQAVAGSGGGNFHYVADPEQMAGAFLSEFGDVYKVIGQNLELSVTAAPDVTILECLNEFPGTVSEEAATINLGDVYSEETKQVVFKLKIPGMKVSSDVPLLDVSIRYDSVSGGYGVRRAESALSVTVSDEEGETRTPDPEVRKEVVLAHLAKARFKVSELMEKGDTSQAISVVKEHIKLIDKQGRDLATQLDHEKHKLEELLSEIKHRGADRRLQKETVSEAVGYSTRGRSQFNFPGEKRAKAEILRNDQERILEFGERVMQVMARRDYGDDEIQNMLFIIKELFTNAVEYGALWCPEKPVQVECRISYRYAKCIVTDQGPGFDYIKTMADLEKLEQEGDQLRTRGRGLLTTRKLADKLLFRGRGNCAEALIFRKLVSSRAGDGHLEQHSIGDKSVVVVPVPADGLSEAGYASFHQEVRRLLREGVQYAIYDLDKVDYASSIGLGLLAYIKKELMDAGGDLALVNMNTFLMKLFRTIQFDNLFIMADSVEEALAILENKISTGEQP